MRVPVVSYSVRMVPLLAALVLGSSCQTSEVVSDYTLQVVPRLLGGQDPFATSPAIKLLLRYPEGGSEIVYLGEANSGELEMPDVGPLSAGTTIGLLLEEPGGDQNKYNPANLLAYGEIILEEDLGTGKEQIELELLLPQFGSIGDMKTLKDQQISYFPGVAILPGGDTYLFGGVKTLNGADVGSLDRILFMEDSDSGDWNFEKIDLTLPEPLTGVNATTVEVDGEALVLITGGRPYWSMSGEDGGTPESEANRTVALLFDPVEEEFVWGEDKKDPKLPLPRSGHSSIVLADGSVFLYGGFAGPYGTGFDGTWAVFDPDLLEFPYDGQVNGIGSVGTGAASLGSSGVLMCGGGSIDPADANFYKAVEGCAAFNLQGVDIPVPDLPEAVAHLAMAPLPGGHVLATGGVQGSLEVSMTRFESGPAIAKAWLFDGSKWSEVGAMQFARAQHVLIPTPTGQVVVVGGVENTGYFYADATPAVLCTEIYDPATKSFSTLNGTCTKAGSGADPKWSALPGEGAFVLEGWSFDNTYTGGSAYGLVGFGPDL